MDYQKNYQISPDTIIAQASAMGSAAIAIVRISGVGVRRLCEDFEIALIARKAQQRVLYDAERNPIDSAVAIYYAAPASYSGEDSLELYLHGNQSIVMHAIRTSLDYLAQAQIPARIAEPGEFTKRAFLHGKLDLAQAEAVADLITANTETATRLAFQVLSGFFSTMIAELAAHIQNLRMFVEAHIDFADEAIAEFSSKEVAQKLQQLLETVTSLFNNCRQANVYRDGLKVTILGRPNVGKSSLLNALSEEDLAIVSEFAGTTRDQIRAFIEVRGVRITVLDNAGLRESSDVIEQEGINRAKKSAEVADIILLVMDSREGVTISDQALLTELAAHQQKIVRVFNKADLLLGTMPTQQDVMLVSAKTKQGLDRLKSALVDRYVPEQEENLFLLQVRHLHALDQTITHLKSAQTQVARLPQDLELFAEELRLAHGQLAQITGEYNTEDLLGQIFSRFCIGK